MLVLVSRMRDRNQEVKTKHLFFRSINNFVIRFDHETFVSSEIKRSINKEKNNIKFKETY